jgi:Spy/CpxP family protein refolding chaperone
MRKIAIWSSFAALLVLMAFAIVRAEARGTRGWHSHRWHRVGLVSFLAHDLKLSSSQRAQIRTLWQMERPAISGHIHELLTENKEMDAMAVQKSPDQTKVEEIAGREATTIAMLLVEKDQLQSKIYSTVLNPEQRAKVDEPQKKWESRLDHVADHIGTQPAEQ